MLQKEAQQEKGLPCNAWLPYLKTRVGCGLSYTGLEPEFINL
jgi:hypothetical protein